MTQNTRIRGFPRMRVLTYGYFLLPFNAVRFSNERSGSLPEVLNEIILFYGKGSAVS